MKTISSFKIAKFEFKVTVHYGQWGKTRSCDSLTQFCYSNFASSFDIMFVAYNKYFFYLCSACSKDNNKSCSGRGKKKKKKNNNCSRNKKSNQQCGPNSQNAWNQKEVKKTQEPRSAAESSTSGTADQINKEERVLLEKGMEKRKQIDEKHSPVGVVLKRVKDKTGKLWFWINVKYL